MTGPLALSPPQKLQFFIPGTTTPAAGAQVFTYAAGTMTKQATYSTENDTPNTNPIILDANGECVCYLDSTLMYDFWYSPSTDTDPPTNPYWTVYDVGYGNMIDGLAPLNSPAFTGTPTAPTPATGNSSTDIATTQFVTTAITEALVSPTLTTPPGAGDYSTKIPDTAWVGNAINTAWQMVVISNSGTWDIPTNVTWAKFRGWGPGGGGGGGSSSPGSGGGGGAYVEGTISLGANTSLAIVIGTPGAGGSPGNAGTSGTATTIAALGISAGGGGGGGANGGAPGPGGAGTGLNLVINGGTGGISLNPSIGLGGAGGPSFGSCENAGTGVYPAGGGGGGTISAAGNGGAAGLVIIEYLAP